MSIINTCILCAHNGFPQLCHSKIAYLIIFSPHKVIFFVLYCIFAEFYSNSKVKSWLNPPPFSSIFGTKKNPVDLELIKILYHEDIFARETEVSTLIIYDVSV